MSTSVEGFILLLNNLFSSLLVKRAAATVKAAQATCDHILTDDTDSGQCIGQGRSEDGDTNDAVPFRSEVRVLTVEEQIVESDTVETLFDKS